MTSPRMAAPRSALAAAGSVSSPESAPRDSRARSRRAVRAPPGSRAAGAVPARHGTRRRTALRVRRPRRRATASSPPSTCRWSSRAPATPVPGPEAGLRLVGLGITVDVGLGVGERQRDHGCAQQPLPTERVTAHGRQRLVPEHCRLVAFEHDEVPSLRLAGARCPRRQLDEVVEDCRFDGRSSNAASSADIARPRRTRPCQRAFSARRA